MSNFKLKSALSLLDKKAEEKGEYKEHSIANKRIAPFPLKVDGSKYCGYDELKELGKGSYGRVAMVYQGGKTFAIKDVNNLYIITSESGGTFIPYVPYVIEASILASANHPNIIQAKDIFFDCTKKLIPKYSIRYIMENADSNLKDYNLSKWTPEDKLNLLCDIASGLNFLHKSKIIHRDLKLENILMVKGVAKIADFGMASVDVHQYKDPMVQTADIRAPEVDNDSTHSLDYDSAIDIWSFGCIAWQLLHPKKRSLLSLPTETPEIFTPNKKTYDKIFMKAQYYSINRSGVKLQCEFENQKVQHDLEILISRCLKTRPEKRPTAEEIYNVLLDMTGMTYVEGSWDTEKIDPDHYTEDEQEANDLYTEVYENAAEDYRPFITDIVARGLNNGHIKDHKTAKTVIRLLLSVFAEDTKPEKFPMTSEQLNTISEYCDAVNFKIINFNKYFM